MKENYSKFCFSLSKEITHPQILLKSLFFHVAKQINSPVQIKNHRIFQLGRDPQGLSSPTPKANE